MYSYFLKEGLPYASMNGNSLILCMYQVAYLNNFVEYSCIPEQCGVTVIKTFESAETNSKNSNLRSNF